MSKDWQNSRQFHINPPRRILPVIESGVVVQFQTGLQAVVVIKLDECEASASFTRVVFLCGDAHVSRRVLFEVFLHGLGVCGVGEVACISGYSS